MTEKFAIKSQLLFASIGIAAWLSVGCGGGTTAEELARDVQAPAALKTEKLHSTAPAIVIDGEAAEWLSVPNGANATAQSTTALKAFYDGATYLYFLTQGVGMGSNYNLFINSDGNTNTGFKLSEWNASGADYLLENGVLYQYSGTGADWAWTSKGSSGVTQNKNSSVFEARIAVSALGNVSPGALSYGFRDLASDYSLVSQLPVVGNAMQVLASNETVSSNTLVVDLINGPYKTIASAMAKAKAGTTILVRPGIYKENIVFSTSGTPDAYLTLEGQPGAIIDGTRMNGVEPLVTIRDTSYVRIKGFEIRNLKPRSIDVIATGILVVGAAAGVQILNNKIHDIWASSRASNVNAHGINVLGDTNPGITNILISGNEIYNMKTGWSENLTLNGNVDGFEVSFNSIHDNNNIGIDIAGGYGEGPVGFDYARNGIVSGNNVYNINSSTNPAYKGVRAAGGIYIDGGQSVTIERNRVDNSDIGIELASEEPGKVTKDIVVRNNFVSRSYQGNIQIGGYDLERGSAKNISIVNNTTFGAKSGEIVVQFNSSSITIKNNILFASADSEYIAQWGSNNSAINVSNNIYYGANTTSIGVWPDTLAKFVNPLLINGYIDMHLQKLSPAKDMGISANHGDLDFDGQTRINGTVDIGADEL
jgi:parallel beta-helix repeat protein